MREFYRPSPVREVFKVYYIPLPRGEDGSFSFLYTAAGNPTPSDFKRLEIKLHEILNPSRSIFETLRYKLEEKFKDFRDPKRYSVCPVRFKVEGEDLI